MSLARARWSGEHLRYDIPHVRLRQVAELVRARSPKRVLDVGCATGHLRHLLPEVEYVGCDFAAPAQPPDFEFHLCDLNLDDLPGSLTDFDVVVCSGILEYLNALAATFRDIRRRLGPSGSFVCTYFNDQHVLRGLIQATEARTLPAPRLDDLAPAGRTPRTVAGRRTPAATHLRLYPGNRASSGGRCDRWEARRPRTNRRLVAAICASVCDRLWPHCLTPQTTHEERGHLDTDEIHRDAARPACVTRHARSRDIVATLR